MVPTVGKEAGESSLSSPAHNSFLNRTDSLTDPCEHHAFSLLLSLALAQLHDP